MTLLILIPLISVILFFLFLYSKTICTSIPDKFRIALVDDLVIGSLLIAVITECLSAFTLLRFDILLITWVIILAGIAICVWRGKVLSEVGGMTQVFRNFSRLQKTALFVIFLLLTCSLCIALIYPVNNYDSQTYHMARVGYWEQNAGISHYPSHILRQLEFPPFAEWVILHLQILTGGDRFANSVQLFFFAGCIVLVSLIAKKLGANRIQQLLTSGMACFIPIAVLESNTTQNDIVGSFFVLAFVYYTIRAFTECSWQLILLTGIALGLAWLTKGSAYVFVAAFCVWYIILIIKSFRKGLKDVARKVIMYLLIPLIAVTINSGHFYRNIVLTGSPLGEEGKGTVVEAFKIKSTVLIAVKNIMNNLPVTRPMKDYVASIAARVGLDADDLKFNLTPMRDMAEGFVFHEDYTQNFFHLCLIFLSLFLFLFRKKAYKPDSYVYHLFILSLFATSFLFTILFKWQPWSNRLLIPLLMLFSIFIGMELGRLGKWVYVFPGIPVVVYGFIALGYSTRHPVWPMENSIFSERYDYNSFAFEDGLPELKKYLDTKPYKKIGIYIGGDNRDYMYYKLLRGEGDQKREIRHVFVDNRSKMYNNNFVPDAIISLSGSMKKYEIDNKVYYQTGIYGLSVLFEQP